MKPKYIIKLLEILRYFYSEEILFPKLGVSLKNTDISSSKKE